MRIVADLLNGFRLVTRHPARLQRSRLALYVTDVSIDGGPVQSVAPSTAGRKAQDHVRWAGAKRRRKARARAA